MSTFNCNISNVSELEVQGTFDKLPKFFIDEFQALESTKNAQYAQPLWFRKGTDGDDECEQCCVTEQELLETDWHKKSQKPSDRIRVVSDKERNDKFLEIKAPKAILDNTELSNYLQLVSKGIKYDGNHYTSLQQDIRHYSRCFKDAVTISIPTVANDILNDCLYYIGSRRDIPIGIGVVNKDPNVDEADYFSKVDQLLDNFVYYQCNAFNNEYVTMHVVKMYDIDRCGDNEEKKENHKSNGADKIKITSSMVSYLIDEKKCNFILYDSDFQLLAVGKYNASYIYNDSDTQNNTNEVINPYRYQSFMAFHSLMSSFVEMSLVDQQKNGVELKSLTSCFNGNIRSCLMYKQHSTIWTPSICNVQKFQAIVNQFGAYGIVVADKYYSRARALLDGASDSEMTPSLVTDECVSDDDGDQCVVCFHSMAHVTKKVTDLSVCHNHSDICSNCVMLWGQYGNHSCPKCGVANVI